MAFLGTNVPHLTGLPNRRQGEERLAGDLARAKRGGGTLTLVDVNGFKGINDSLGYQAGDACTRHVAQVMQSHVREGDWLARWGADEFILALWVAAPPPHRASAGSPAP